MVGILNVDRLTLLGVVEGIGSDDLLTLDSMQQLPCFIHGGISFPVIAKQVCNTSIQKEASLDRRLGDEFAFGIMKFLAEYFSFQSDECFEFAYD